MIDSLLRFFAAASVRAPWPILIVAFLLAAISGTYAALKLELNADTDDLIARDRPFMDNYLAFLDEFGDLEFLFVVVERGDDQERTEACIEYLGEHLKRIDLLPEVFYAIEPDEQLRIATRSMDDAELRELALIADAFPNLLADDAPAERLLADARERLRQVMRLGADADADVQERLGAAAIFQLRVLASAIDGSNSEQELAHLLSETLTREYLRSESGELYFVFILPVKDYGTMSVIEEPVRMIREVIDDARQEFPELRMGLTGKPVLQYDEMATTGRDMTRASILAVILVSILFMIVIGGVWHPLLAVSSLIFGIAWTFGVATLFIGQLNLLSVVFTLVLVGVGIDFGIHLVARYKEEIRHHSIEDAIRIALTTAGRGNVTGAITSSMAFFMAIFTEFQGLRELGFIAGTGLLLCLVAMTLVLPSMLAVFDGYRASRGGTPSPLPPKLALEARLWHILITHPMTVLGVALAVTLLIAPGFWRISFQENLLELQAEGLESVEWEHRLLEDSAESWFGAIIVDSLEKVSEVIDRTEDYNVIASTGSVFDVIREDSEDRRRWRERLQYDSDEREVAEPASIERSNMLQVLSAVRTMATAAERQGIEDAPILRALAEDIEVMTNLLEDSEEASLLHERIERNVGKVAGSIQLMLDGDRLALRDALPRAVRDRFVSPQGNYLVKLHPAENIWEFGPMEEFVNAMRAIDPDATGVPITQYESLIEMQRAFITAATLAFIAVFILLLLDLRSFRDALLAVGPLVLAMVWLVEWMGMTGIQFNLANFFAVPILIGIGVDSGIHIVRRYREGGPRRLDLGSTRRAVAMTSLTSMIGFGCLATASHRGLFSLGLVMAIGAVSCLIASLIVLPAVLAWLDRRSGKPVSPAHE